MTLKTGQTILMRSIVGTQSNTGKYIQGCLEESMNRHPDAIVIAQMNSGHPDRKYLTQLGQGPSVIETIFRTLPMAQKVAYSYATMFLNVFVFASYHCSI